MAALWAGFIEKLALDRIKKAHRQDGFKITRDLLFDVAVADLALDVIQNSLAWDAAITNSLNFIDHHILPRCLLREGGTGKVKGGQNDDECAKKQGHALNHEI